MFGRRGGGPVHDAIALGGIRVDAVVVNMVSEEIKIRQEQMSFLIGTVEGVFAEGGEDGADIGFVFLNTLRPDDDVVEINVTDFADPRSQRVEHAALVCRRRISTPLRHDEPLVQAKRCRYCRVLDVVRMYAGLEEGICHVNLRPDLALCTVS